MARATYDSQTLGLRLGLGFELGERGEWFKSRVGGLGLGLGLGLEVLDGFGSRVGLES